MLSSVVLVVAAVVGQASGEKAFRAYADHAVGGVWTTTIDGNNFEHSYRWLDGNKFIQLRGKGGKLPYTGIVGVDPETTKCTWWCFTEDGGVGTGMMSLESDGVWIVRMSGVTPAGKYSYEGKLTRMDQDTLKEDVSHFTIAGKDQAVQPSAVWKRIK